MKREIVEVLTNVNGTPVTTFEDQRDNAVHILRNKGDAGARKVSAGGAVLRSKVINAAVNSHTFYNNRYRLLDDNIEILSTHTTDGFRIIDELERSGRIPFHQINVAVIKRDGLDLKLVGQKTVTDTEFIKDFTHKLNKEAMKELLPIIFFTPEVTGEDKLPI